VNAIGKDSKRYYVQDDADSIVEYPAMIVHAPGREIRDSDDSAITIWPEWQTAYAGESFLLDPAIAEAAIAMWRQRRGFAYPTDVKPSAGTNSQESLMPDREQAPARLCHDCGVAEGALHVPGCDMERCPFCGGQLIGCDCCYRLLHIDASPGTWAYEHGLTDEQSIEWDRVLREKGRVPYTLVTGV